MKRLAAILIAWVALPLQAAQQASFITALHGAVGRHFTLLNRDCSAVYYLPSDYVLDKASGVSVYQRVNEIGNDLESEPVVRIKLLLRPRGGSVTPAEAEEFARWAAQVDPKCAGARVAAEPYPPLMVRVTRPDPLSLSSYRVAEASYGIDNSVNVTLEVSPQQVDVERLIEELNYFTPAADVAMYDLRLEASVKMKANYAIAADFALHRYEEKVCHHRERCLKVFGRTIKCKYEDWCDVIPKVVQYFDELHFQGKVELEIFNPAEVPEHRVTALKNQLFSRFLMSSYRTSQPEIINGVMQVTLGELRKEATGQFADQEESHGLRESFVTQQLQVEPVGAVLAERLRQAFKQTQTLTMRKK